jgi:Tfp pilus assembly protein PilN
MISWLMTLIRTWFFPKEELKKIEQSDARREEFVAKVHAAIEKKAEEAKAKDSVDAANDIINGL